MCLKKKRNTVEPAQGYKPRPSKAELGTTSATSNSRPSATLPSSLKSRPSTALVQRHLDNAKKTRVLPSKAELGTTSATSNSRPSATLPSSLKSEPSAALVQRHLDNAKKTRVFQLRGCRMKTVPIPLEETVSYLRALDISQNKIKEMPPFFTRFSKLKQLSISENRLTELPDEIGNLKTLEVLNVSFNKLLTLPDTLVGCASLNTLTATNNKFQIFPDVIARLPNVEYVDLSGNFIKRLPAEISTLHATELNLNRNKLSSIHTNLAKCRNLKVLRVEKNCLHKKEFSTVILEESRISLIAYAGNYFQDKDFQNLPGYEKYQERFTATKKKGV